MTAKSELAPEEDQGVVIGQIVGAPNATAQQMNVYAKQMFNAARTLPEYEQMFQLTGVPTTNQGIGGVLFKPWEQRSRSAHELQQVLQEKWNDIAGAQGGGLPVPAAAGRAGPADPDGDHHHRAVPEPQRGRQEVLKKAQASGKFYFIDSDLKVDKPQSTVSFDRDMITALGLTQQDVGARARRRAGRRLRQLLLDRRPLLPGDSAGTAGRPAQPRPGAQLLHPRARRLGDSRPRPWPAHARRWCRDRSTASSS